VPPLRQAHKAQELFVTAYALSDVECSDVEKVRALVTHLGAEIRKLPGAGDFKEHRLNQEQRREQGLDLSRRRYNKLFRFLARFEQKVETYHREQRKYRATRVAKSSLAISISYHDFTASREAACFLAYYSARSNRRSVFTNQSQDRAYDEVAQMLLERFKCQPHPQGWRAIAYVMPDVEIVQHLSDEDKLELLGLWLEVLQDIADLLQSTWEKSRFNRATMIVKRGDDSSTWNALAGAWNAARQGWISLMHALGLEKELEQMCFGKVLRLMAADVAFWHRASGGGLEPDTQVWAELPAPWEVFSGNATCTRAEVEAVCQKYGVDPVKKGWTFPRQKRQAVPFQPTPELVHGVAVSHPALALMLRQAGWFSGKSGRPLPADARPVTVHRDATGAVLGVGLVVEPVYAPQQDREPQA
jgi:hypothetical protein